MWIIAIAISSFLSFLVMPTDTVRETVVTVTLFATFAASALTIIGSLFTHVADVGRVRIAASRIDAAQDRVDGLLKNFKEALGAGAELNEELLAKANTDSPIQEMIDRLAAAEYNLESERNRLHHAQETIQARNTGPLRFIVEMYGEE